MRKWALLLFIVWTTTLMAQNAWIPQWEWLDGWYKTYRTLVGCVIIGIGVTLSVTVVSVFDREIASTGRRRATSVIPRTSGGMALPGTSAKAMRRRRRFLSFKARRSAKARSGRS